MHFSRIELYNFGIYRGHHVLNLQDRNAERNITLIGGMNGRGKTTLLDAVFLGLYGKRSVEFITGKKTSVYNAVLLDHINKSAMDQRSGIRIMIELDDEDDTTICVEREWNKSKNGINSTLKILKNNIEDQYLSKEWDFYVEEIIPFGIAKFFFFDNEKISQIADDDAFDKIKDSIKSLIGVTTIESLKGHIEKIRKDKTAEIKKEESSELTSQLETLQNAMDEYEEDIKVLVNKRASLYPLLKKAENDLELAEARFWESGGLLSTKKEDIQRDQQELKKQAVELKESALLLAANPAAPLNLCLPLVRYTYDRLMEGQDHQAKRYTLPIISRMYDQLLMDYSRSFSHNTDSYKFLSDLVYSQLNQMKADAEKDTGVSISPISQSLFESYLTGQHSAIDNKARELSVKSDENHIAQNQLEVHLSNSTETAVTKKLLEDIRILEAQKSKHEAGIEQINQQIREIEQKMKALEGQINKTNLKIAAEADAGDNNVRIVRYATMTLEVMDEFARRLQAQKVNLLEENIKTCFDFLAQKDAMITSIIVDPDTLNITLKDYKGGILQKNQLSAGEKQMFAISILWGLALTSGYKLPVIIDTPLARLDSSHRSNFINKYLPNASSQVLVLSTDEEVNGKYLDDIRKYLVSTYTLVYDEEEKCSTIEDGYFGGRYL